jgi:eukaryotic-like serine/threonine-protein kinase
MGTKRDGPSALRADGPERIFIVAAARDEPSPPPALRALLSLVGKVRAKVGSGVKHIALQPLSPEETARLAQAVTPVGREVERAVVHGSGRVPFFVVHALTAWRETGAIVWRHGAWRAPLGSSVEEVTGPMSPRMSDGSARALALAGDVPGVADLLEARLASYFDPGSAAERSALRALAAIALYGGGLSVDTVLRVAGDDDATESALETLAGAGILTIAGDLGEVSFAQEMVRQAALNRLRSRPWFHRLHRALLDAVAKGQVGPADAAFLATGYEKLGAAEQARVWLSRAMDAAIEAGLFGEAAELGDRLAALTADPEARATVELDVVRALIRGRQGEEASARLARIAASQRAPAPGSEHDARRRIYRLEIARERGEAGADDPSLLADVDALGDQALRCEVRMALAGATKNEARGMELAGEAIELSARASPAVEFEARVLRFELNYAQTRQDLEVADQDLRRALAIAEATSSTWHKVHIEGDLAALEAERGRTGAAIDRLKRLVVQAEAHGMREELRRLLQNLAALLLREGRGVEAAEAAGRAALLHGEEGDSLRRGMSLSLRAEALRLAGDLDAALVCAGEAERLQAERGDRWRSLTLLRRAEILDALGRFEEALGDVRTARDIATEHEDRDLAFSAGLWEGLRLARRGQATREALERAVSEAERSGVTLRALTQRLIGQAKAWLAEARQ